MQHRLLSPFFPCARLFGRGERHGTGTGVGALRVVGRGLSSHRLLTTGACLALLGFGVFAPAASAQESTSRVAGELATQGEKRGKPGSRDVVFARAAETSWMRSRSLKRFARRRVRPAPRSAFAAMRPGTGPTRDVVVRGRRALALAARVHAASAEMVRYTYTDAHGHEFGIQTYPGVAPEEALDRVASLLSTVPHSWEIEHLEVLVVNLADMPAYCGSEIAQACYLPRDPDRSFDGWMIVGWDDPELPHTVAHEYGHHMDNRLLNIAHLSVVCSDWSGDGSRRWFIARELSDDIFSAGFDCIAGSPWETQLAELYAEDFAVLAGSNGWGRITAVPPPSGDVLSELSDDIHDPLLPRTSKVRGRLSRRGSRKVHRFRVRMPTFFEIRLNGPKRAEMSIALYEPDSRRPLARTRRRGSRDYLFVLGLLPGTYRIEVRAGRAGGTYRMSVGRL